MRSSILHASSHPVRDAAPPVAAPRRLPLPSSLPWLGAALLLGSRYAPALSVPHLGAPALALVPLASLTLLAFVARRQLASCDSAGFALFVYVTAVSVSAALEPRAPFAWTMMLPYALAGTFLLARALAWRLDDVHAALAIAAVALAASIIASAELRWPLWTLHPPAGLLGNRNYAAEYLALGLPALLTRVRRRDVALAVFALVGVALAWTRCRTAVVAAVVAGAVTLAAAAPSRRALVALALAALVGGAALSDLVPNHLHWNAAAASDPAHLVDLSRGSGQLRLAQYRATLELVAHHPIFGIGPGRWQPLVRASAWRLAVNNRPHSDYLRALSDGGVVGFGALVVLLGLAARDAWRLRRDAAALGILAALIVVALADSPLYRLESGVAMFAWLGALTARSRTSEADPPRARRSRRR